MIQITQEEVVKLLNRAQEDNDKDNIHDFDFALTKALNELLEYKQVENDNISLRRTF
jgi:hypothetical protein